LVGYLYRKMKPKQQPPYIHYIAPSGLAFLCGLPMKTSLNDYREAGALFADGHETVYDDGERSVPFAATLVCVPDPKHNLPKPSSAPPEPLGTVPLNLSEIRARDSLGDVYTRVSVRPRDEVEGIQGIVDAIGQDQRDVKSVPASGPGGIV
jgi:hypothetical protein